MFASYAMHGALPGWCSRPWRAPGVLGPPPSAPRPRAWPWALAAALRPGRLARRADALEDLAAQKLRQWQPAAASVVVGEMAERIAAAAEELEAGLVERSVESRLLLLAAFCGDLEPRMAIPTAWILLESTKHTFLG